MTITKPINEKKNIKQGEDLFFEVIGDPGKSDAAKLELTSFMLRNEEFIKKLKVEARSATLVSTQQSVSTFGHTVGSLTEEDTRLLKRTEVPEVLAILGTDASDVFKDPYDLLDKIRIHETWREDGNFAASIDFLMQFVLGEHFQSVIDINNEFDNEEDVKLMLQQLTGNPKLKKFKKIIDRTTRKVNFTEAFRAFFTQYLVFGRACMIVEKDPETELPISLKVLPSMSLGQVYVHRRTWEMLGVEFLDFQFPQSILKKEEIIYEAFHDYNISASTKWYGYALTERILHLSELNRIITQRNLKEANYRLWAPVYLIKSLSALNPQTMEKIRDQIANGAGNSLAMNQNVDVEVMKLQVDPEPLTKERDANDLLTRRHLQIPEILFDPKTMNRATSDELMQAFVISVAAMYRRIIKDVIQRQWINPMLTTLIRQQGRPELEKLEVLQEAKTIEEEETKAEQEIKTEEQKAAQESEEERQIKRLKALSAAEIVKPKRKVGAEGLEDEDEKEIPAEDEEEVDPEEDEEDEQLDPNDPDYDVEDENWKIKAELEEINLDTPIEKTASAIKLYQAGMITLEKALKMMDMEDEIEAMRIQKERNRQQMLEQGLVPFGNDQSQNPNDQPGKGVQGSGENFGSKKTGLDRKLDAFKTSTIDNAFNEAVGG